MATDTRERLIRTAHDLFHDEGFHAVGLDRILREVGVTKTTFYNHFESKDQLITAALEWHDRWWQDHFRAMLRRHGGDTPRGQLAAVPGALAELFDSDGYNGCMFINVGVEYRNPNDPAHRLAARHKRAMEDLLGEIGGYAGADDPAALAAELALVLEGAYVTQQLARDGRVLDAVRRVVTSILDRHLAAPPGSPPAPATDPPPARPA